MSSRRVISMKTFSPFALPPVRKPLPGCLSYGRCECFGQVGCVAWLVARGINTEPDAFGDIAAFSRIGGPLIR
jgi:hypothetical protein